MNWMALGVAGLCGVYLRAGVVHMAWPMWSTFLVNVLGCFLMGVLVGTSNRWLSDYRSAIAIGFLGGLTTFSGLVFDLYKYQQQGQWNQMLIYFVLTHAVGIGLLFAGLAVGSKV